MFGIDIPSITEIFAYVVESLKTNQFAQGGFVIGLIASVPRFIIPQLKLLYQRIERLIVYRVTIEESDDLYMYFEMWLSENFEAKYRNVEAALKLNTKYEWDNKDVITGEYIDELEESVLYKQYNDVFYIRRGLLWLRVFKGREKLENASNVKNLHHNRFVLSGVWSKRVINNLIAEVHDSAKTKMKKAREKSIRVKTSTEYGDWVDENVIEPKKLHNIILDGKEALMNDIDKFLKKKAWYRDKEIAYKRGYLLHGQAGTGKTTLIMAIAKQLNRTVHFLQTNKVDDKGIRNAFRELPPNSIMVVEDIDAVFNQRDDGSKDIKFSFSTLLNCLDGVFSVEDVIVIFTTNHKKRLDPALIRCGRVDYEMEFELPTVKYVEYYLQNFFDSSEAITLPQGYKENLPMVEIQDSCLRYSHDVNEALAHIIEVSAMKANGDESELRTAYVEPKKKKKKKKK